MLRKGEDKDKPEAKKGEEVETEDTQRERIESLLDEGYTPVQIEKEWGYSHTSVQRMAKKKLTARGITNNVTRLPSVLKAGGGQEVISPEAILQGYLMDDGDAGEWMLKGMMLLRAAQMMVLTDVEIMKGQADAQAKAIKPVLDIMEQNRKDMDAAAERARASSMEMAEVAAAGAAARATMHIDQRFDQMLQQKADIAMAPDPMKGLMARTMETIMNRMTGQMFGQVGTTPGLVDKR